MEGAIARRSAQQVEVQAVRQAVSKKTTVRLGPGLAVVFEESRSGSNQVSSHRTPQVLDPGLQLSSSCEVIGGPCVPNGRFIGSLHLSTEKLVARAQREAEVLA